MNTFKRAVSSIVFLLLVAGQSEAIRAEEQSQTNNELAKKVDEYKTKVDQLEAKLTRSEAQALAEKKKTQELASKLKINGYITAAVATNDGKDATLFNGLGDYADTNTDSKLGLQLSFQLNDRNRVVAQLASHGQDYQQVTANWLYIDMGLTPSTKLIAGRFAPPYYLLSEYLQVGFAYPWVRPPVEVYNIPVSGIEGFELQNRFDLFSSWTGLGTLYAGRGLGIEKSLAQSEFSLDRSWGATLDFNRDDWTFRLGYNQSSAAFTNLVTGGNLDLLNQGLLSFKQLAEGLNTQLGASLPVDNYVLPIDGFKATYMNAAIIFDNSRWLVMSEVAKLHQDTFPVPGGVSGYIEVGRRFGKWMPSFTIAKFYTDESSDRNVSRITDDLAELQNTISPLTGLDPRLAQAYSALPTVISGIHSNGVRQQTSFTADLVYTIMPQIKAKLELAHYEGFDGTKGRFDGNPGSSTEIYSFSIDAVF